ncbi:MAG: hypothetical protein GXY83_11400 [Rhodopirellula sp.]|nr:hypothetical protein [Rhodopirellula sp.]
MMHFADIHRVLSLLLTATFLLSAVLLPDSLQADTRTFFAFDDQSIPKQHNLQLTLVQPTKHPDNPVVRRGGKGACDEWAVQFYGSVLRHEGKFKLWYVAADNESLELIKRGLGFSGLRPAYAESEDGIHWQKPNLGLVEHRGSKQNNLVLIDPPEAGGIHLIVLHEADEADPARRFKMLLTVAATLGKSKGSTSITLFSPDGLRWKSATPVRFEKGFLVEEDLILPPENFEQGGLYRWNGMYHLPGQQFSPWVWQPDGKPVGRVMTVLRSRDLIQWEPTKTLGFIRGGAIGQEIPVGQAEEAHLAASVWHRNNVLLGVYGLWHGAENWQDRTIDLGFLISNDGLHFREPIRDFVLIPRGEEGQWDQGGLLQGQGFANVGDQTYHWYGSWDLQKPSYPPRGGVGLVTLPRDRFGYLSSHRENASAEFVTELVAPERAWLFVNVEGVSDARPLRVELLDAREQPLPGYSGENAAKVTTCGTHVAVAWPTGASGAVDAGGPFFIRAVLPKDGDVRVYAVYVEQAS